MGCKTCGGARASIEYEVKFTDGKTKRVESMAEVRILLATERITTYKAVPKPQPK